MEKAEEETDFRKFAANLSFAAMMLLDIYREWTSVYCYCCFTVKRILIQLEFGA